MSTDSQSLPAERSSDVREDELRLADLIRFLLKGAPLALLLAVLAAALYWGFSWLTYRPTYEAAASLVVTPLSGSSSFRPAPLTVTSYKQLLDSPSIIAETRERLVSEKILSPGSPLRSGRELRSRLFFTQQGRRQERQAASMIELTSRSASAEAAARAANLWAQVFLERTEELVTSATLESLQAFEKVYPEAQSSLSELQREHDEVSNGFEAKLLDLQDRWSRRVTAYKQETLDKITAYEAETDRLVRESRLEGQRSLRVAELEALRQAYRDTQEKLADVDETIADSRAELETVKERMAVTSETLKLEKAPPDELLWQPRAADGSSTLRTEEVNPVWVELEQRLARVEIRLGILTPRRERLGSRAEQLEQQIQDLEASVQAMEGAQTRLASERAAGLHKLQLERESGESELVRRQNEEIAALERQSATEVAHLSRKISAETRRVKDLDKSYTEASMTRAQLELMDVRLSTAAVEPVRPEPRGINFKLALAAVLGVLAGYGATLVRQVLSTTRRRAGA
ncbi:MAG: hypothetical protein KDD47_17280 [Acidobacteria bacterium]|nr:hypothetical protein [Acidobacteriota bacterium]